MKTALPLLLGLAAIGLVLTNAEAAPLPSPTPSPTPSPNPGPGPGTPRTLQIIGDSYAVGIAGVLKSLAPGAQVVSQAVVGQATPAMHAARDDGSDYIISAPTNDLAAVPSAVGAARSLALSRAVDGVVRVLGPFALPGLVQHGGRAYLVLPHDKMTSVQLAKNVQDFLALLVGPSDIPPAIEPNANLAFASIGDFANPVGADKLHFDAAGYSAVAQHALSFFNS